MKLTLGNKTPTKAPSVAEQAAALQLDDEPTELVISNPLLPNRFEDRDIPVDLKERLIELDRILSADGKLPIDTCRLACRSVMQCLKANEDSILALEPEDIQFVIQGYIKTADAESQRILTGTKKKGGRPKKTKYAPEVQAKLDEAAKLDDDFEDAF